MDLPDHIIPSENTEQKAHQLTQRSATEWLHANPCRAFAFLIRANPKNPRSST
jgi:hypothetical protein